jgi:serine/threonine protein kinase
VIADAGPPPSSLPLPSIINFSIQMLAALCQLHRQDMVMMNLKPQNVLLDEDPDELYVTDFGLSKPASHSLGSSVASAVGYGMLRYM